jgi:hypothetical protein
MEPTSGRLGTQVTGKGRNMSMRPAACALLLLFATSAHAAAAFSVADQAPSPHAVQFVDERPAKELKGGLPLLFDPTYSVPDARLSPGLLDLLGSALEKKLGDRAKGLVVTVRRLQVQNYFRATYERSQAINLAITAGLAGVVLAAVDSKQPVDAVLFRLEGSVQGHEFSVNLAEPYEPGKVGMGMVYNGSGARAATRKVVDLGVAQSVTSIEAALDSAVNASAATPTP